MAGLLRFLLLDHIHAGRHAGGRKGQSRQAPDHHDLLRYLALTGRLLPAALRSGRARLLGRGHGSAVLLRAGGSERRRDDEARSSPAKHQRPPSHASPARGSFRASQTRIARNWRAQVRDAFHSGRVEGRDGGMLAVLSLQYDTREHACPRPTLAAVTAAPSAIASRSIFPSRSRSATAPSARAPARCSRSCRQARSRSRRAKARSATTSSTRRSSITCSARSAACARSRAARVRAGRWWRSIRAAWTRWTRPRSTSSTSTGRAGNWTDQAPSANWRLTSFTGLRVALQRRAKLAPTAQTRRNLGKP